MKQLVSPNQTYSTKYHSLSTLLDEMSKEPAILQDFANSNLKTVEIYQMITGAIAQNGLANASAKDKLQALGLHHYDILSTSAQNKQTHQQIKAEHQDYQAVKDVYHNIQISQPDWSLLEQGNITKQTEQRLEEQNIKSFLEVLSSSAFGEKIYIYPDYDSMRHDVQYASKVKSLSEMDKDTGLYYLKINNFHNTQSSLSKESQSLHDGMLFLFENNLLKAPTGNILSNPDAISQGEARDTLEARLRYQNDAINYANELQHKDPVPLPDILLNPKIAKSAHPNPFFDLDNYGNVKSKNLPQSGSEHKPVLLYPNAKRYINDESYRNNIAQIAKPTKIQGMMVFELLENNLPSQEGRTYLNYRLKEGNSFTQTRKIDYIIANNLHIMPSEEELKKQSTLLEGYLSLKEGYTKSKNEHLLTQRNIPALSPMQRIHKPDGFISGTEARNIKAELENKAKNGQLSPEEQERWNQRQDYLRLMHIAPFDAKNKTFRLRTDIKEVLHQDFTGDLRTGRPIVDFIEKHKLWEKKPSKSTEYDENNNQKPTPKLLSTEEIASSIGYDNLLDRAMQTPMAKDLFGDNPRIKPARWEGEYFTAGIEGRNGHNGGVSIGTKGYLSFYEFSIGSYRFHNGRTSILHPDIQEIKDHYYNKNYDYIAPYLDTHSYDQHKAYQKNNPVVRGAYAHLMDEPEAANTLSEENKITQNKNFGELQSFIKQIHNLSYGNVQDFSKNAYFHQIKSFTNEAYKDFGGDVHIINADKQISYYDYRQQKVNAHTGKIEINDIIKTDENGHRIILNTTRLKANDVLTTLYHFNDDNALEIAGAQHISSHARKGKDGLFTRHTSKKHLHGTQKKGAFTVLNGDGTHRTIEALNNDNIAPKQIIFVEGVATGLSVMQMTQHLPQKPIVVFFADAKNMHPVVTSFVERYHKQGHEFIIAADNDEKSERKKGFFGNVGKANAAELAYNLKHRFGQDLNLTISVPNLEIAQQKVAESYQAQLADKDDAVITKVARAAHQSVGSDFNDVHSYLIQNHPAYLQAGIHAENEATILHQDENIIIRKQKIKNDVRKAQNEVHQSLMANDDIVAVSNYHFGAESEFLQIRQQQTQALIETYQNILTKSEELNSQGVPLSLAKQFVSIAQEQNIDIKQVEISLQNEYAISSATPFDELQIKRFNDANVLANNQHYGRMILDIHSFEKKDDGKLYANGVILNSNISTDGGYQPKTASIRLSDESELKQQGYTDSDIQKYLAQNERFEELSKKRTDAQGVSYLGNGQLVLALKGVTLDEIQTHKKHGFDSFDFQKDGKINHYTIDAMHYVGQSKDYLTLNAKDINTPNNDGFIYNNVLARLNFVDKQSANLYTSSATAFTQLEVLHGFMENKDNSAQEIYQFLIDGLNHQDINGNARQANVKVGYIGRDGAKESFTIRSEMDIKSKSIPVQDGGYVDTTIHTPKSANDTLYDILTGIDKRTANNINIIKKLDVDNISSSDIDIIKTFNHSITNMSNQREWLRQTGVDKLIIENKEKSLGLPSGLLMEDYQNSLAQIQKTDEQLYLQIFGQDNPNTKIQADWLLSNTVYNFTGDKGRSLTDSLQKAYDANLTNTATIQGLNLLKLTKNQEYQAISFVAESRGDGQMMPVKAIASTNLIGSLSQGQDEQYRWNVVRGTIGLDDILAKSVIKSAFVQQIGNDKRTPWLNHTLLSSQSQKEVLSIENPNTAVQFIGDTLKNIQTVQKEPLFVKKDETITPLYQDDKVSIYADSAIHLAHHKIKSLNYNETDLPALMDLSAKNMATHPDFKAFSETLTEYLQDKPEFNVQSQIIQTIINQSDVLETNPTFLKQNKHQNDNIGKHFIASLLPYQTFGQLDDFVKNKSQSEPAQHIEFKEIFALKQAMIRPTLNGEPLHISTERLLQITQNAQIKLDNTIGSQNINTPAHHQTSLAENSTPNQNSTTKQPDTQTFTQNSLFGSTKSENSVLEKQAGETIIGQRTDKLAIISAETFEKRGLSAWNLSDIKEMKHKELQAALWMMRDALPAKPRKNTRTYSRAMPLQTWSNIVAGAHENYISIVNNYNELFGLGDQNKAQQFADVATSVILDNISRTYQKEPAQKIRDIVAYDQIGSYTYEQNISKPEILLKHNLLSRLPMEEFSNIAIGKRLFHQTQTDSPVHITLSQEGRDTLFKQLEPSARHEMYTQNKSEDDIKEQYQKALNEKVGRHSHLDMLYVIKNTSSGTSTQLSYKDIAGQTFGEHQTLNLIKHFIDKESDAIDRITYTINTQNATVTESIFDKNHSKDTAQSVIEKIERASKLLIKEFFDDNSEIISTLSQNLDQKANLDKENPLTKKYPNAKFSKLHYTYAYNELTDPKAGLSTEEKDLDRPIYQYRLALNKSREIDIHTITTRDLLAINEEQGGTLLTFKQESNTVYVENKDNLSKIFESDHNNISKIQSVLKNFSKMERTQKETILSGYADAINQSYVKDKENKQTVYNIKDRDIRQSLDEYQRVGPAYDEQVLNETLLRTFGVRGIEYGSDSYIKTEDRNIIAKNIYHAYKDMAQALNIPENAIGLGGTLGLTFGRHGRGGNALAFYDRHNTDDYGMDIVGNKDIRLVGGYINLTRNGFGTVAHEWLHALDNYLSDKDNVFGNPRFATAENPDSLNMRQALKESLLNLQSVIKSSDFYARSRLLDLDANGKSRGYWSSPEELTARAFESYVHSKLEQKGINNRFLVNFLQPDEYAKHPFLQHIPYPYPTQEESIKINEAFEHLFTTLKQQTISKTLKSEQGDLDIEATILFSKLDKQNTQLPIPISAIETDKDKNLVLNTLREKFGADIDNLLNSQLLNIISTNEAKEQFGIDDMGQAQGFYDSNSQKSYLVANNLTQNTIIPTFLHELGAHHGLQKIMNQKDYDSLMQDVHSLIDDGDTIALQALKRAKDSVEGLSPKEMQDKVINLELLPYLITSYEEARPQKDHTAINQIIDTAQLNIKAFFKEQQGSDIRFNAQDLTTLAYAATQKIMLDNWVSLENSNPINQTGISPLLSMHSNTKTPLELGISKAYERVMEELRGNNDERILGVRNDNGIIKPYGNTEFLQDYANALNIKNKSEVDYGNIQNADIVHFLKHGGSINQSAVLIQEMKDKHQPENINQTNLDISDKEIIAQMNSITEPITDNNIDTNPTYQDKVPTTPILDDKQGIIALANTDLSTLGKQGFIGLKNEMVAGLTTDKNTQIAADIAAILGNDKVFNKLIGTAIRQTKAHNMSNEHLALNELKARLHIHNEQQTVKITPSDVGLHEKFGLQVFAHLAENLTHLDDDKRHKALASVQAINNTLQARTSNLSRAIIDEYLQSGLVKDTIYDNQTVLHTTEKLINGQTIDKSEVKMVNDILLAQFSDNPVAMTRLFYGANELHKSFDINTVDKDKARIYESNNENAHTHISTLHKNLFDLFKLQTPKHSIDELASEVPRQKLIAAVISSAMRNDEAVNLPSFTESQGYKERTASYGVPPKPEGRDKLLDYTKILNAQQDIAPQKSVNSLEKQQSAMTNLELLNTDLFNNKEVLIQQQLASTAQEQAEQPINKRLENPANNQAYLDKIGKDFSGATAEHISNSFDKTREYAKTFVSKGSDTKELVNFYNGYTAIVSSNNLDKMLNNKAHTKSDGLHLHLTAVANADKLFENAVFGWEHQDKDERNGNQIHRAIAPLKIDEQVYLVKLTIKELAKEQGSRVYSLEAVEIENEKSPIPEMMREDLDKQALSQHRHNGALIDIIVQNTQKYNKEKEHSLLSQDVHNTISQTMIGHGGVFDKNVQDYVMSYLTGDKYTHDSLKESVQYFKNGDVKQIANEFVLIASYDKSAAEHFSRVLNDAGIGQGLQLRNRPTASGIIANNEDFKQVASTAANVVAQMALSNYDIHTKSHHLEATDDILHSFARKEVGYKVYGNNGTFKDIKDIVADLQIENLSPSAKLSLDMPPPKQNPPTFDDHHAVCYDNHQVKSAKSLLAAVTLSDADLKDPIKTTQKLLVRDVVESTFKAIGTEESLKFVQLLHTTNPSSIHYKELGISGNQVNSVANRQAVFGSLKELVGSEAFDVIQKHALTYGLHQKTLDKDENHLTAKRQIKHALQKIELPLHTSHQTHSMMIDPSVVGEANKLMQNLSNFGHLDKSVIRSRMVGRYPQTMLAFDEGNLHRVFDTALSRLKAGIEVSDDILKEAINARASYDDSFKLTAQMIDRYGSPNHLTIQNPKYTLETMSDDQKRVVDELSGLAMVKLAWSPNEKTAYHKHQSFEAVANLIKDTQTDKSIWQVLSDLQKSNDTLKAIANNQQVDRIEVNSLANKHQTMDFNEEQTLSI